MTFKVITAPEPLVDNSNNEWVFLAGSIEMGAATQWQQDVISKMQQRRDDITIFNPRRKEWNPDWEQSITCAPFKQQVEWELEGLAKADSIIMHFDPSTKAPITLLELGLFADRDLVVSCPDGYWRKGNVEIVCDHYGLPLYNDLDTLLEIHYFRFL
jgi:hypothetical protein